MEVRMGAACTDNCRDVVPVWTAMLLLLSMHPAMLEF